MSDSKPLPLILVVGAQNWIWYKSKCNRSILFLNFAQIQPINILDNFWQNHSSMSSFIEYGMLWNVTKWIRLQDHTGSSCGRADHTTTIFFRVVLSHNHNHNIFYMFWRTNIWWVCPSIVMWGLFLKRRERDIENWILGFLNSSAASWHAMINSRRREASYNGRSIMYWYST